MAKKKQTPHIISEEKQLEALEAIAKMSPEQQQELLAFAEEFQQMPEEIQDMMVDFINMIDQMPKSEKEEFMQHMEHLDTILNGDSYYAPAYQREHELPSLFATVPDGFPSGPRNHNQEDFTLYDLLTEKGKSIEWEYDFGDSWYHDVKLSSIGDYKADEPLVSFIKGERECPPEDCGGIWGYQELLGIYEKKKSRKRLSSEEKDRLAWYEMDEDFDPDYFNTDFAHLICEDYCE